MEENFTKAEKELLLNVKAAYDRIGTVCGVAKELNLQAWRVKKYLRRGHRYRLFTYDKFYRGKKRFRIKLPPQHYKHKESVNAEEALRLLRLHGSIRKVSEEIGVPQGYLYALIRDKFKSRSIIPLKKHKYKSKLSNEKLLKIQRFKELYDRLGTLEKVGQKLKITRERVRQILADGVKYKIFDYLPTRARRYRLKELKNNLTREDVIKEIKTLMTQTKICLRFNIRNKEFEKLLKHFNIDYQEYSKLARMGKYVERYTEIVNILGHHPTTTEMNSRPDWRSTWSSIDRYWGNMDNFRSEFGIEKPKQKMPEKFFERNRRAKSRRSQILDLLKERSGRIPYKEIALKSGVSPCTIYNDIARLRKEGMLTNFDIRTRDYNEINEKKSKILTLIQENNAIGIEEISKQLGLSNSTVYRYIHNLRKEGKLSDIARYYKGSLRIRGSREERKLAALNLIKENNAITAVEIASKLSVHRSRIYEAINELQREGKLIESDIPWNRRTTDERKNTLLNLIRNSGTLNVRKISKQTGIPVIFIYRYIRELRKEGKLEEGE